MTEALTLLKQDLHISTGAMDDYLANMIVASEEYIRDEGVRLDLAQTGDLMLLVQYAAFLYRSRAGTGAALSPVTEMPRPLRWALNNRLMQQKGGDSYG